MSRNDAGLKPKRLGRLICAICLGILAVATGCKGAPRQSSMRQAVRSAPAAPAASDPKQPPMTPASAVVPDQPQSHGDPPDAPSSAQAAASPAASIQLEDVEERKGSFIIAGQAFFASLHYKRLPGKTGPDSQALALLEIRDAAGGVAHREAFPYSVEHGEFTDTCSAAVEFLKGSNGKGVLIDSACLPSAPMSGGPWQILGVVNGKLVPFGKPLVTEGEMGGFVPGAINRFGAVTQILPDVLKIRVWTGYFFAPVSVRVDWLRGQLALAQHCYYQTGHGPGEEGCEFPVEDVERRPGEQDLTFVRLFRESNERTGSAAHIVVKKDSKVEFLAGKALAIWDEGKDAVNLSVGDDIWIKVRIDGTEGWIHTMEDLNAIGLSFSG